MEISSIRVEWILDPKPYYLVVSTIAMWSTFVLLCNNTSRKFRHEINKNVTRNCWFVLLILTCYPGQFSAGNCYSILLIRTFWIWVLTATWHVSWYGRFFFAARIIFSARFFFLRGALQEPALSPTPSETPATTLSPRPCSRTATQTL